MRSLHLFALPLPALLSFVVTACSSSAPTSDFAHSGKDGGPGGGDDGGVGTFGGGTEGGPPSTACAPSALNYDIPGNGCDDDGDGTIDNVRACDTGLTVTGNAADFAKALGLCQAGSASAWGVVSAEFTHDFGKASAVDDDQHGILGKFGDVVKPREGSSLGVLSSGFAREYDCGDGCTDAIFQGGVPMLDDGTVPSGFPKAAQNCDVQSDVHDVIDFKVQIKVPNNAKGIQFDFDFWSGEWPQYVCTSFNDGFIAYLKSSAFNGGAPDNISFDAKNNPVSVNNGFFDRCTPNATVGCAGTTTSTMACAGGPSELAGTGFFLAGDYCNGVTTAGGATGWLTSQAPVAPGETITIDFLIWDTHDQSYDSSVLLDHLTWLPGPVTAGTTRPPPK
jgi:hypothetical protein